MPSISSVRSKGTHTAERQDPVRAELTDDPNHIERERDKKGRLIGVRRLNLLEVNRIIRLLGDDAKNDLARLQVAITCSVVEIDGEPITIPRTQQQLDGLMLRVDLHGFEAAQKALERLNPVSDESAEAEEAEIKN